MYESPINIIQGEMQMWVEGETYKALQNVGIDVNKEELLKALQYDRGQYEKGYKDGYAKAIDEFAERLKENYQSHAIDICLRQNDYYSYSNACHTLESYIDEIAEEMRGAE